MTVVLHTPDAAARWLAARCTGSLRTDSRQVRSGDAFIAWPGAAADGRAYVARALADGAAACLVEAQGAETFGLHDERVAQMPALKSGAGLVADAWFDRPTEKLPVLAVTGTNGKTSTAWWLAQALTASGRRCGVVGTLGIGEPPTLEATGLTTPDPVTLQAAFARFVQAGFGACAIEASSIGIAEQRLVGTRLAVALFTNFTRDHLDYHGDMDAYWSAKRELFNWPGLHSMVVNVDDARGAELAADFARHPAAPGVDIWTVALAAPARLRAEGLHYRDGGLAFDVVEGAQRESLRSGLIGDYNAHNLLLVLGGLRAMGVALELAVALVPRLTPVPGRMQRVAAAAGPEVVVDYAHTPDALEKALASLQPLAQARGGALWCVFGCGGDRDATKRPLMGEIAGRLAAQVIVTSDNPRREEPQAIVAQIMAGLAAVAARAVVDRHEAIATAVREAAPADVILIAGKGHEDYQDIGGIKLPFSDVAEAQRALEQRA